MAKNLWTTNPAYSLMDERIKNLIDECKRQQESCLYTSTALFEWVKFIRCWKYFFIVAPIVLGTLSTWSLISDEPGFKWITGSCALLAGMLPAIYKALELDISLDEITRHANLFKILQDRFRLTWTVTGLGPYDEFRKDFSLLMEQMDAARTSSIIPPERFFKRSQVKIKSGHYDFNADTEKKTSATA